MEETIKTVQNQLNILRNFVSEIGAISNYSTNGLVTLNIPPILTEIVTQIQNIQNTLDSAPTGQKEE